MESTSEKVVSTKLCFSLPRSTNGYLIKYDRAITTYKMINGLRPDSLRGRFITRSKRSSYSTRNHLDNDIPRQDLEFSKGSFFYSGAKTWNEIPKNIRMSPKLSMFKGNLKKSYSVNKLPKHDPGAEQQHLFFIYIKETMCVEVVHLYYR